MNQKINNPKDVRFSFFGTSNFSIDVLDTLEKNQFLPTVLVTMPDAPAGRGLAQSEPPVSVWGKTHGIEVVQPEVLDDSFKEKLKSLKLDISIVASYGKIIPYAILSTPRHETLNVHPSLLPKYRGPTPIASQIKSDDKEMGVSIMVLDEKVDHGGIIYQEPFKPSEWPLTSFAASHALALLGGKLLARVIVPWIEGVAVATPQDHEHATFTKKSSKEDGNITDIEDQYKKYLAYCAFEDSIGTYFFVDRKSKKIRIKIKTATFKDGVFSPSLVIPEGGREMLYQDFLRGL